MSIKKPASLAAVVVLGLLALGQAAAPAHTGVRLDPGNLPFSGAATIQSTPSTTTDPFTLRIDGFGEVTCNSHYLEAHLSTLTGSSTVTGGVTALTLQHCSDTVPVISISSCHLDNTAPLHVQGTATGAFWDVVDSILRCFMVGSNTATCSYTASLARGTFTNVVNALSFTNVPVTHVATSGDIGAICGQNGVWSTTFTHIAQVGTNRTVTFTN